jgi:site-specific DNA-cytosine methylase
VSEIPTYNVIDLFAGVVGIGLGFRDDEGEPRCKFRIRLMVDKDREASAGRHKKHARRSISRG